MKSMLAAVMLCAGSALGAAPCQMNYTNSASKPVTVCLRHNGAAAGEDIKKTLAPGEWWAQDCKASVPGQSWQSYFAADGLTECGFDQGCEPATGTCKSYPWVMGQGVGTNGLWYGSIGTNWDGAGLGYTGGFDTVSYGLHFECNSYNETQHPDLKCGVEGGAPFCTPNKPNYGQPNSGVVECDNGGKSGEWGLKMEFVDL